MSLSCHRNPVPRPGVSGFDWCTGIIFYQLEECLIWSSWVPLMLPLLLQELHAFSYWYRLLRSIFHDIPWASMWLLCLSCLAAMNMHSAGRLRFAVSVPTCNAQAWCLLCHLRQEYFDRHSMLLRVRHPLFLFSMIMQVETGMCISGGADSNQPGTIMSLHLVDAHIVSGLSSLFLESSPEHNWAFFHALVQMQWINVAATRPQDHQHIRKQLSLQQTGYRCTNAKCVTYGFFVCSPFEFNLLLQVY
jgi:hypothetical protein